MSILNINGKPYTSATEDVALQQLKKDCLQKVFREIQSALRRSRGGQLQMDPSAIINAIDQAYFLGKENSVK